MVGEFQQHSVHFVAVGIRFRASTAQGRHALAVGDPSLLGECRRHRIQGERWPSAVLCAEPDEPARQAHRVGVTVHREAEQVARLLGDPDERVGVVCIPAEVAQTGQ